MKILRTKNNYYCDLCDEWFHTDDNGNTHYRSDTVYYQSSSDQIHCEECSDYYDSPATPEDAWWCGNGCFHHDQGAEPEIDTDYRWVCSGCGISWDDKQEAFGCCLWPCSSCNKAFRTAVEAHECCRKIVITVEDSYTNDVLELFDNLKYCVVGQTPTEVAAKTIDGLKQVKQETTTTWSG